MELTRIFQLLTYSELCLQKKPNFFYTCHSWAIPIYYVREIVYTSLHVLDTSLPWHAVLSITYATLFRVATLRSIICTRLRERLRHDGSRLCMCECVLESGVWEWMGMRHRSTRCWRQQRQRQPRIRIRNTGKAVYKRQNRRLASGGGTSQRKYANLPLCVPDWLKIPN